MTPRVIPWLVCFEVDHDSFSDLHVDLILCYSVPVFIEVYMEWFNSVSASKKNGWRNRLLTQKTTIFLAAAFIIAVI